MALTVVFADDNYLVREGIAALLTEIDDVELVDAVADPASLLKAVAEHQPDAVLTDIRMPRRSPPKASVQPNRFDSTI
ncbi:MAG: response regulator transcription factor [Aeromicrobium sp.]